MSICLNQSKSFLPEWYEHFAKQKNIFPTFEFVHTMRDSITPQNFETTLVKFLSLNEGFKQHPYLDTRGNWHIGYGLLLKNANSGVYEKIAIDAFKIVLNKNLSEFIPIEQLNKNTCRNFVLTIEQCHQLLLYVLKSNVAKILKLIPKFVQLPLNMQISLHSLYYNAPALIGPNLVRNLNAYIENDEPDALLNCLYEIEHNSNPIDSPDWKGIQNRRYYEGAMLSNKILDIVLRINNDNLQKFVANYANAEFRKLIPLNASCEDINSAILNAHKLKKPLNLFPKINEIVKILLKK